MWYAPHPLKSTGKTAAGVPWKFDANGFEAIVLQHELDHLDGKLFLDRVMSLGDKCI